jgi:hypothetical protein
MIQTCVRRRHGAERRGAIETAIEINERFQRALTVVHLLRRLGATSADRFFISTRLRAVELFRKPGDKFTSH